VRNKFKEEELSKDKKMIKEVLEGNFKCKKRKWIDMQIENSELDDGEENIDNKEKNFQIGKRKKLISCLINSQGQETQNDISYKNKKIINISKYKKQLENFSSENPEAANEFNEILFDYEKEIKNKISEQSSAFKRKLSDRIKENNQILENVIDLNKTRINSQQVILKSGNPFLSFSSSQMSQNSMLNAMKKDKYFSQKEFDKNAQVKSNEINKNANSLFPMFNKYKNNNNITNSEKKNKISAIFKKGDVTQKVKMN
jgi:hypothetical protein